MSGTEAERAAAMKAWEAACLAAAWYARPNDLIGGWCVMPSDEPPSSGGPEVADFTTDGFARHVADLHNAWLARSRAQDGQSATRSTEPVPAGAGASQDGTEALSVPEAVAAERERLAAEIEKHAADCDGPHLTGVAKAHLDGLRVAAVFIRDGLEGVAGWEPQP